MVITAVLHTAGPRIDTVHKHYFLLFLFVVNVFSIALASRMVYFRHAAHYVQDDLHRQLRMWMESALILKHTII